MIINFEEIRRKQIVKGVCYKCNKRRQRILNEWATINPFNKDENGFAKTRQEIVIEVETKLDKKVDELTKNFICSSCE